MEPLREYEVCQGVWNLSGNMKSVREYGTSRGI
jgi:hypothetical protein